MAYIRNDRDHIIKLLQAASIEPEALPNLFHLGSGFSPALRGSPRAYGNPKWMGALQSLADWRQFLPETIDSIYSLGRATRLPTADWGDEPGHQQVVRDILKGYVSRMSGNPKDLERQAAFLKHRPSLLGHESLDRPTLHEMVLTDEPAGPQFSQSRFEASLPPWEVGQDARTSQDILANFDEPGNPGGDVHPIAERLIRAQANNQSVDQEIPGSRFGDRLAADALLSRLSAEHPTALNKLLELVRPGITDIPLPPVYEWSPQKEALGELNRRIGSIYSQQFGRFSNEPSSQRTNQYGQERTPTEREARYREFLRRPLLENWQGEDYLPPVETIATNSRNIYERMRAAEFKGGQQHMLETMQESQPWEEFGRGGTWDRVLSRTAKMASNPTNVEIQKILNENLGFGEGKMAGSAGIGSLLGIAGLGAAAAFGGPKLAKAAERANVGAMIGGAPGAALGLISSFL